MLSTVWGGVGCRALWGVSRRPPPSPSPTGGREALRARASGRWLAGVKVPRDLRLAVDIDPQSFCEGGGQPPRLAGRRCFRLCGR
jgi:hypothetical protein